MCEDHIMLPSSKYKHGGGFILGRGYSLVAFFREIKECDSLVAFWQGIAFPSLYTIVI